VVPKHAARIPLPREVVPLKLREDLSYSLLLGITDAHETPMIRDRQIARPVHPLVRQLSDLIGAAPQLIATTRINILSAHKLRCNLMLARSMEVDGP